jgi:hypothetical protein
MCVCVRVCVRACVRVCVCVYVYIAEHHHTAGMLVLSPVFSAATWQHPCPPPREALARDMSASGPPLPLSDDP